METILFQLQHLNFDRIHWILLMFIVIATMSALYISVTLSEKKTELKNLKEKHLKTSQELNELKKTFAQQSQNYESLTETSNKNKKELESYKTAYTDLFREHESFKSDLGAFRQREADVLRRENERNKADKTIGTLQSSLAFLKNDLAEISKRLDKTKAELQEAKKTIETRNAAIDQLKHLGQSESRYRKQRFVMKCTVGDFLCRLDFKNEADRQRAQQIFQDRQKEFRKLVNQNPELMEEMQRISNDFIALSRAIDIDNK